MFERYQRNNFTKEQQEKLKNSTVFVAGLGGLGSGVIASLCGLGIGKLILLDNDVVNLSNLNRQFIHREKDIGTKKTQSAKRWVEEFNPEVEVELLDIRLNEDNLPELKYDIIVDCFDNFESKFLLNKLALRKNISFIHGGVDGSCGQVATIIPNETACLNCFLGENIKVSSLHPVSLAPVVNIVSSIQSSEALKLLLNLDKGLENQLLRIDLKSNLFKTSVLVKNPNCCS